jgi:hypothetical protein
MIFNPNSVKFTSTRQINTTDPHDYQFELNKEVKVNFIANSETFGQLKGQFPLKIIKSLLINENYDDVGKVKKAKLKNHGWIMWAIWFIGGFI